MGRSLPRKRTSRVRAPKPRTEREDDETFNDPWGEREVLDGPGEDEKRDVEGEARDGQTGQ